MHEFRSAEEQRRNTKQRGQGHQGGGEPGAKTNQPPCDLLPGTQEYLIYYRGLPCERTHHGKGLSQVTSFFSFFLCPQRTPTQRRLLHASPYLASSRRHGSHLLDLLIIIEIHPIIISTERSRAVEQRKKSPPAGHALATPPRPPAHLVAIRSRSGPPDLKAETTKRSR